MGYRAAHVSLLVAALGLAYACVDAERALGAQGQLAATYVDGFHGCHSLCAVSNPMAPGAAALIEVHGVLEDSVVQARSTDEAVMRVAAGHRVGLFILSAGAPGDARLEVTLDGVQDQFPVAVRSVVAIEAAEVAPFRAVGEPRQLDVRLLGDGGALLRGLGAVTYRTSANLQVRRQDIFDVLDRLMGSRPRDARFERVLITGDLRGGEGEVWASVGSLERRVPVEVVEVELREVSLWATSNPEEIFVSADFDVVNEEPGVFGCCEWDYPAEAGLLSASCDRLALATYEPAVTVTCRAHGVQSTVTVRR